MWGVCVCELINLTKDISKNSIIQAVAWVLVQFIMTTVSRSYNRKL